MHHTLFRLLLSIALVLALSSPSQAKDQRLEIESSGWTLVGDLTPTSEQQPRAFAVLLHKAAGNRQAYGPLAQALANAGIASLRIDLRGHGESTNLGAFDPEISRYYDSENPEVVRNFALIRAADQDIVAIMNWLCCKPKLKLQHIDLFQSDSAE